MSKPQMALIKTRDGKSYSLPFIETLEPLEGFVEMANLDTNQIELVDSSQVISTDILS